MRYDHIINHPHHVSSTRKRMSNYDRAAQFSSFKALSGFEDSIDESARYVEQRLELTEVQQDELNTAIQILLEEEFPTVAITYFIPDSLKCGGTYVTYTGTFRFLETATGQMKFVDGTALPISDIYSIEFVEPVDTSKKCDMIYT